MAKEELASEAAAMILLNMHVCGFVRSTDLAIETAERQQHRPSVNFDKFKLVQDMSRFRSLVKIFKA